MAGKPDASDDASTPQKEPKKVPLRLDEPPIVTEHTIEVDGKPLAYTVTTGTLPLLDAFGEPQASVFYMAYTIPPKDPAKPRPLTFSFNGGPGSCSVWLHLGALGPRRVKLLEDGGMPAPPFELVDNPETWLDHTDLVFIDPVGTGYSRAATEELNEKYWGIQGDIDSIGEFIRLYLTRNERWNAPLFLVGESYGTTRAAGLSGHLIDRGIAFNGILLVSSILQFQTLRFTPSNDLPYVLYLPTYTATAWYHGKLEKALQKDLRKTLKEAEAWAEEVYAPALLRGDRLSDTERQTIARDLARYTGLSETYTLQANLRIEIMRFCKELLREENQTVGRFDSRYKGIGGDTLKERPDFDPSGSATRPAYTAMINHYMRTELGYQTDEPYHVFGPIKNWDWGSAANGHPDTSESLRLAFAKNSHMQLFVASGYYDLATPYYATEHTLAHMGLDPVFREQITVEEYEAGHMMYVEVSSLKKLKKDVAAFLKKATKR